MIRMPFPISFTILPQTFLIQNLFARTGEKHSAVCSCSGLAFLRLLTPGYLLQTPDCFPIAERRWLFTFLRMLN